MTSEPTNKLNIRWLGRTSYSDGLALQQSLFKSAHDYLLLCEHNPVYTFGRNANSANAIEDLTKSGADIFDVSRGGDVTFHGPGQLVGYPIITIADSTRAQLANSVEYVHRIENLLICVLEDLGVCNVGTLRKFPGVWVNPLSASPKKIAAIGVRIDRGRTMHGFALNSSTDLDWFSKIIPCGIGEFGVTSLAELGVKVSMETIIALICQHAYKLYPPHNQNLCELDLETTPTKALTPLSSTAFENLLSDFAAVAFKLNSTDIAEFTKASEHASSPTSGDASSSAFEHASSAVFEHASSATFQYDSSAFRRQASSEYGNVRSDHISRTSQSDRDVSNNTEQPVRLLGRLAKIGVGAGKPITERKPEWMRVNANFGNEYRQLKALMRNEHLTTVCEEAGCPNIFECWQDKTATFMVLGERCTRACGFCLIDTQKPLAPDQEEPERVARAALELSLSYVVITMVARDDLPDGGASHVAATIHAIREAIPDVEIEALISDCKGDPQSLDIINNANPTVLNHNIETVARLQRAVRPSASYPRSLAVLSRAKSQGLTTKSGIIVGMGETDEEVLQTLFDLAAIGVDIVTIGQYLRPTTRHLPVQRWVEPETFEVFKRFGEDHGISHVESSPLTRSSYHAKSAQKQATLVPTTGVFS